MAVTARNIVQLEDLEHRPITNGMGHIEGDHWQVFTKEAGGTEALRLLVQEYPPPAATPRTTRSTTTSSRPTT